MRYLTAARGLIVRLLENTTYIIQVVIHQVPSPRESETCKSSRGG